MPIRKYGTEPARVEVRAEDNDQETLESFSSRGDVHDPKDESPHHKRSERGGDNQTEAE